MSLAPPPLNAPAKDNSLAEPKRESSIPAAASGSLAAAKFIVGIAIGSLALISDALQPDRSRRHARHPVAVRIADQPPDEEHHYGHGKVESVAALAEAALLFLLAGGVAVEAVSRLQTGGSWSRSPSSPSPLGIEMAVNG